ncbi:MAG: MBL fold metallo-hydrolase [Infirmifilum sp.]
MSPGKARVFFLGTSGSTFTEDNIPPCIYVEGYLFDCPAACPQKLKMYGLLDSLHTILLSHTHIDHSLGIYELAWHLGTTQANKKVTLYLPASEQAHVEQTFRILGKNFADKLLSFVNIIGVDSGLQSNGITVVAAKHSVPALGYRLDLNGTSICYTGDTAPSREMSEAFKDCKLLIHDSSYPPGEEEKAALDGHSTPIQAAEIAKESGARMLALVHLPYARLGRTIDGEFLKAARKIFPNTIVPKPGDAIDLVE